MRKAAPSTLSGKPFGINEQFPKEINDRRRVLYPQYIQAKRMGGKAVIVADTLFVDEMQIFPTKNHQNMPTESESYKTSTAASRAGPARVYSRNANAHTPTMEIECRNV